MAAARGLSSRPRNWCGSTVRPSASQAALAVAQLVEQVEHFAFQALHVLQGDIEEVAGAAGRVEHAHLAEAVVEAVQFGARRIGHRQVQQFAQLAGEALRVGEFGAVGVLPADDEGFGVVVHHGRFTP
jgi:hypothetical protein